MPQGATGTTAESRILRPGGLFAFSAWAPIAANEFADAVTDALAAAFPHDPPRFMARTPHGYHEPAVIAQHLAAAGFRRTPKMETVAFTSRAASPHIAALAYCEGTPLRGEIEARDRKGLARATRAAAAEVARRFGEGPIEGRIEALVVTIEA